MDFDTERIVAKEKSLRSLMMISLMGGVGIIIPFIVILVATFKGVTELSMFNSMVLFVLSILILLFLVIKSASSFFNNDSRLFVAGIVFIVANLISLMYNITIYMVF
ncbi:MAG: hypothetical protein HON47_04060 [Candidatus Diapherotrites archaeon]|uniref:Uncharacterized protein n=1 Tax=Candidatus Iainarchaeum sp. TaxID=3101447 RepID=A0A8T5GFP8_9ARCH|nr:hypothetical protein [Candidatus Diapherotrites archaeon]